MGFTNRDFWETETEKYSKIHFRLEKCARVINTLAKGRKYELLDIGCGPGTLARLLNANVNYFGIDLVIHDPKPNLLEMNILESKIRFGDRHFDFVTMLGILEYLGEYQNQKLKEVQNILKKDGRLILTYLNFNHVRGHLFDLPIYNNVKSIGDLISDLESFFTIDDWYPTYYNWNRTEPRREWLKAIQMPLKINIPFFSEILAGEYTFVCSKNASVS